LIRSGIKAAAGSKGLTSHRHRMPCFGRACRSGNELFDGSLGWGRAIKAVGTCRYGILRTGQPHRRSISLNTCYSYRHATSFRARRGSHDQASKDYRIRDCRSARCRRHYRQRTIALAFDRSCCSIVRDLDCGIDSWHKESPDRGFRRPVAGFSEGDESLSEGINASSDEPRCGCVRALIQPLIPLGSPPKYQATPTAAAT